MKLLLILCWLLAYIVYSPLVQQPLNAACKHVRAARAEHRKAHRDHRAAHRQANRAARHQVPQEQ
ncbi:MAG: hypothetical protein KGL39_17155 [Patescibacteria group bacterium]|nr:hypothetical protein [Patescibacteria group bacterium]